MPIPRYSDSTLSAIAVQIQLVADGHVNAIASVWLQGLNQGVDRLLRGGYRLSSTTGLAAIAEALGYDRQAVIDIGPAPWAAALESAEDNLHGEQRHVFLAFLMAIALSNLNHGAEVLFQRAFDSLHSALWNSTLSQRAFNLLIPHLPAVWWWQQWDNCLRLRLGVVQAYREHKLNDTTFHRSVLIEWSWNSSNLIGAKNRRPTISLIKSACLGLATAIEQAVRAPPFRTVSEGCGFDVVTSIKRGLSMVGSAHDR